MMTTIATTTVNNNSFKTFKATRTNSKRLSSSRIKNASSKCLLENRITMRKRNSILSKTTTTRTTRLNVVSANASSSSFEQEQNNSAADVFVSEMESSQIVSSPKNKSKLALVATTAALSLSAFAKPAAAAAAAAIAVNAGDTAWILTSSALVLFMTIPGLAAFYAGLVKRKNLITVLGQCFALTCMMTIIWFVCGYSMCFSTAGLFGTAAMKEGTTGLSAFIGGLDKMFLAGVGPASMHETIPEILWVLYQCTFAIITPALMVGSMVERMKFNAVMWYCALWSFAVYFPACHMVWGGGGGYFADLGVLDFAGGIVVHITAGIGALVAAIKVGKRKEMEMTVGNLVLTFWC
ncbi:unnamed protein product [Bathycoccus prasinos]